MRLHYQANDLVLADPRLVHRGTGYLKQNIRLHGYVFIKNTIRIEDNIYYPENSISSSLQLDGEEHYSSSSRQKKAMKRARMNTINEKRKTCKINAL